jgi:hypothetical protein
MARIPTFEHSLKEKVMQKLSFMLASVVAFTGLVLVSVAPAVHAQSTGVALSCGTNFCQATASSPASPTPFQYTWSYTGTAHLSAPFRCNNDGPLGHKSSCGFRCYQPYQDHITMHVNVVDAAGTFIGDASAGALCNGSIGDQ